MTTNFKTKLANVALRRQTLERLKQWADVSQWQQKTEQYCEYRLDGASVRHGWVRAKQYTNGTLWLEAQTEQGLQTMLAHLNLASSAPSIRPSGGAALYSANKPGANNTGANKTGLAQPHALASALPSADAIIGQDESGKGDYFGPLVIASCLLESQQLAALQQRGIADCKLLSNAQVLQQAEWLKQTLGPAAWQVTVLMPKVYNQLYARIQNLNTLLAWSHALTLERLLKKQQVRQALQGLTPVFKQTTLVIIDQFANASVIQKQLQPLGRSMRVHQQTKAESIPAVAAASVLARAAFLEALAALSDLAGVRLAPGAGDPVLNAGRQYIRLHGAAALSRVAKTHFKITEKLGARAMV
ncbi:MAG: ribonuclease HIII [Vampirovibrionales bacterium]|nr:ribonuclease HIII [Vampirovibrionales bacterium]